MSDSIPLKHLAEITPEPMTHRAGQPFSTLPAISPGASEEFVPRAANGGTKPGTSLPAEATPYSLRLQMIEQFCQTLSSGSDLPRVLRLALKLTLTGAPPHSGACVMWLDTARNNVTVVDAVGWHAHRLKSREIPLAQLGSLQLATAREGNAAPINVVSDSEWQTEMPLVAEGKHLIALPLLVRGEPAGLLGLMRSGEPACRGEEALFLQTLAALVSTAICHSRWQREIAIHRSANKVIEQIDPRTTASLPFMQVLRAIARAARELSGSERVVISAVGVDGKSRIPLMVYGKRARLLAKENIPFAGLGRWAVEHGEATFSNDMGSDPRVNAHWVTKLQLESGAAAPLWIQGRVVGCFAAYNRGRNGHYSERDLAVLSHFAGHAAAAIESASLSDYYRYTPLARTLIWQMLGEKRRRSSMSAAAEERRRLARELHDGLAQNLSNLNFRLQLIEQKAAASENRDAEALKREIGIVRGVVATMYEDVRLRITALDTREAPAPASDDLTRQLREFVGDFAEACGVPVQLRLPSYSVRLAPIMCSRLLQIIQEACTNVRKHAQATHVQVALEVRGHLLTVRVRDDGRGCTSGKERYRKRHFGLKMMRDRAREIGGQLHLTSHPGRGAEISVSLPIREEG